MDCSLVFDIRDTGLRVIWFPSVGLIFVAVGVGLVRFRERLSRSRSWASPFFVWFFLVFGVFWTCIAGIVTVGSYFSLRHALTSGRYQSVEGVVRNFKPMPDEGHAMESFDVGAQHFGYSDYVVTPGFNTTRSHGGPITEGAYVKICHHNGTILRLEVCRPGTNRGVGAV